MQQTLQFTATESSGDVHAIFQLPQNAKVLLLLSHGAGAGMYHAFMEKISNCLAENGIGTFRFNFPYMEQGRKSPGSPAVAIKTIVSAYQQVRSLTGNLPILAGGKSYGGRMTSLAVAQNSLPDIKGLVFFGFPLHQMGKPSMERAAHFNNISVPMLFLQGSKDKLADISLIKKLTTQFNDLAKLSIVEDADHSFHVPKKSGLTDDKVLTHLAATVSTWTDTLTL